MIKLRKEEVLRYLGHGNQALEPELEQMIEAAMTEIVEKAPYRSIYEIYPIEAIPEGILVQPSGLLLKGVSIAKHLVGCTHCALLAVTLGNEVERLLRTTQVTNLTKSVILNACATEAVELYTDQAEAEIRGIAQERGWYLTGRFSPGYGDLPIEIQSELLNLLQAYKRIGLTVTPHHILMPRKSVTACIGLGPAPVSGEPRGCESCRLKGQCTYRKGGRFCELSKTI